MLIAALAAPVFALISPTLQAQQHVAHVHGVASLSVAVEGRTLSIELSSPAANILGFEHVARSDEERDAIVQARANLEQADTVFDIPSGECKSIETAVDVSGVTANPEHDAHDGHGHGHGHGHEKEHTHHHADEPDNKDHDSHDHSEASHSEIVASYLYQCDKPTGLTTISTSLTSLYPRLEKIDVMWISDTAQGGATLTKTSQSFTLK